MSRTYNTPSGEAAGTYGQAMPAIPPGDFIQHGERRRILFAQRARGPAHQHRLPERRRRPGGGPPRALRRDGPRWERKTLILHPLGNEQINRVFEVTPVNGYVDVSRHCRTQLLLLRLGAGQRHQRSDDHSAAVNQVGGIRSAGDVTLGAAQRTVSPSTRPSARTSIE